MALGMYENLGIHWASSVPAFLALACLPFPLLFYRYGASIRAKGRYCVEAQRILERMETSTRVDGARRDIGVAEETLKRDLADVSADSDTTTT